MIERHAAKEERDAAKKEREEARKEREESRIRMAERRREQECSASLLRFTHCHSAPAERDFGVALTRIIFWGTRGPTSKEGSKHRTVVL